MPKEQRTDTTGQGPDVTVNALIALGKKQNLRSYTIKDIELLDALGRQIGLTIDNALHHKDLIETERLTQELRLGRKIQMDLLPKHTPKIPGLSLSGFMRPAKEIGGDYYDFITLPQKHLLGITIGDVSGKGVAAGLMMAVAKTALYSISQQLLSPKQILLQTNQVLYQHIGGQKFMTLLYLCWDSKTNTLHYSSAGHEHILIYRKSEDRGRNIEVIKSGGVILGMLEDIEPYLEEHTITLNKGDKLLLYTDGATEAQNPEGGFFGLPKLTESFKTHSHLSIEETMNNIYSDIKEFMSGREQYDDIALVGMGVKNE